MTGRTLVEARELARKGERDIDPADFASRLIQAELILEKLGVHATHKGKGLGTHWEDRIRDLDSHVELPDEEEPCIIGEFVTQCGKVVTLWSDGNLKFRDIKSNFWFNVQVPVEVEK